jgi:hypothetical protein
MRWLVYFFVSFLGAYGPVVFAAKPTPGFDWEEFCQTALLSSHDAFAIQLPLDDVHRDELLTLTQREMISRWENRPLADFGREFVDRLALVNLLGGSASRLLDRFPVLQKYRESRLSVTQLIRRVRALRDASQDPNPLPEHFQLIVQILDIAGDYEATVSLISQALAQGAYSMVLDVVSRTQSLKVETRDLIYLKIYDIMSKRGEGHPVLQELKVMVNALSLIQSFEHQNLKHQLLWILGMQCLERGASEFAMDPMFVEAHLNDQMLSLGLTALRLSGETVGYFIGRNSTVRAITRITKSHDHHFLAAKVDSLFKQRISDNRTDIWPLVEIVFALNAPPFELDTMTLVELWQNTLDRRLKDLIHRSGRIQSRKVLEIVQNYALASAQLSRLLGDEESIHLLLEQTASGQLGPLSHEMFDIGLIAQILMQLPKGRRNEGLRRAVSKVPSGESSKFYKVLLTEALRKQSGLVLSGSSPWPVVPMKSYSNEAMERVIEQIVSLRGQVDSIHRTRKGPDVDLDSEGVRTKVARDEDYAAELRTTFLRRKDGSRLLLLARLASESGLGRKMSAVETYVLGLLIGH